MIMLNYVVIVILGLEELIMRLGETNLDNFYIELW